MTKESLVMKLIVETMQDKIIKLKMRHVCTFFLWVILVLDDYFLFQKGVWGGKITQVKGYLRALEGKRLEIL